MSSSFLHFSSFVAQKQLIAKRPALPVSRVFQELLSLNHASDNAKLGVLRVLRVTRVFRVFKLGKYSTGVRLLGQVIVASFSALVLLAFFLLLAVVLFGSTRRRAAPPSKPKVVCGVCGGL